MTENKDEFLMVPEKEKNHSQHNFGLKNRAAAWQQVSLALKVFATHFGRGGRVDGLVVGGHGCDDGPGGATPCFNWP